MDSPSLLSRESITLSSRWPQNGQVMSEPHRNPLNPRACRSIQNDTTVYSNPVQDRLKALLPPFHGASPARKDTGKLHPLARAPSAAPEDSFPRAAGRKAAPSKLIVAEAASEIGGKADRKSVV